MKTLLQINSSLTSDQGMSSRLANQFVSNWQHANPSSRIITRDLAMQPVPHLTAERFQAFLTAPDKLTPVQQSIVSESDTLISELKAADVIVLGLPMYNLGIPSTLKAWIDHVARAGVTFRYTASGSEGLLGGRKAYVFTTRGGHYKGTPMDTQSTYITNFLNFIGITDVEIIFAEGLAISEQTRAESLEDAARAITRLAA